MMSATSGAIITENMPENKRGKSFGIVAAAVASALCVGPVAGGALAGAFGWRAIFLVNIPIGLVGTLLAVRAIPRDGARKKAPLDIPGSLLLSAALLLILLPLNEISSGMGPLLFAVLLASGLVLLAAFILYERKAASPVVQLSLFRNRTFSAGITAAVFNYAAQFIIAFLAPFYLQDIRHFSPAMTGLLYLPMPVATLLSAPFAGTRADKIDTRLLSAAGMGIMAVGMLMLSFLGTDTSYAFIIIFMALCGLGSGLFQSPNNAAVMSAAPADVRGVASGTLATGRNLGMALGVALSAAIFTLVSGTGIPDGSVDAAMRNVFIGAMHVTYLAAAGAAVLALFASLVKERRNI
jgi:MFS family permease